MAVSDTQNKLIVCAAIVFIVAAMTAPRSLVGQSANSASKQELNDLYAPLRLYNGQWDLKTNGDEKVLHISNHCEKTGVFFACEQVIDGNEDLIIFLPTEAKDGTKRYRTQELSVKGDNPGEWGALEITGDHWVYSDEEVEKGVKVHWRTINLFFGPDHIHFEIQRSDDGKTWTTKQSGEERRMTK